MANPLFTDAVPRDALDKLELAPQGVSLTLTRKDGGRETFRLRGLPEIVDEHYRMSADVGEEIAKIIDELRSEDADFCFWLLSMIRFHWIYPPMDPRRARQFDIETFEHSEALASIAKFGEVESKSPMEQLLRFADVSSDATSKLLHDAIYVQPPVRPSLGSTHIAFSTYIEWRAQFLSGIIHALLQIEQTRRAAWRKQLGKLEADEKLTPEQCAHLEKLKESQVGPKMKVVLKRVEKDLVKNAFEMVDHETRMFEDVFNEANRLYGTAARDLEKRGIDPSTDISSATDIHAVLDDVLEAEAVDRLLHNLILKYEEAYGFGPHRDLAIAHTPETMTQQAATNLEPLAQRVAPGRTVEFQQYVGFWSAQRSKDPFARWYLLGWIRSNLFNRSECVRLLQRESESAYHALVEMAFVRIFRRIGHRMTRYERRAYLLQYARLPIFNYRFPATDPVIRSFFAGMDGETRALIVLVLVFKIRRWEGREDLQLELERRWRAYLRFYPYWLEIIRDEERQIKRQLTEEGKTLFLEEPLATNQEGETLTLMDKVADPNVQHQDWLQVFIQVSGATVEEWTRRYCTRRQAGHIVRRFVGEKAEVEIALEDGITQQAVSKSIRSGMKRIRKGLSRKKIVPHEKF